MNKEIIFSLIYCIVTVGAFCAGKYIFPKIPESAKEKLTYLAEWAAKFVIWAREFLKTESGEEKMAAVVRQLKAIAEEAGLDVTEEQLKAIAQTAYEAMKAGEAEVQQPEQLLEVTAQPLTTPTVIINTGAAAVATDKVPDGALQQNPDGTVNTYDADGNKVGTISAEEAERTTNNVCVIITEDNA